MRFTDLVYAFPDLLLIILLRSVLGGDIFTLFLIIGIVTWVDLARLVRGQVLSLKEREFVEAARSLGATDREIMRRHLLPNLARPDHRGRRLRRAAGDLHRGGAELHRRRRRRRARRAGARWCRRATARSSARPHLVIFPAVAIALLMLAFTFLGDGLRDALDPRIETAGVRTLSADAQTRPAQAEAPAEEQRAA